MTMIPSHFYINIARARGAGTRAGMERGWDGKPVFAHYATLEITHSATEEEARRVFADSLERYPADQGFKLTLMRVECFGKTLDATHGSEA